MWLHACGLCARGAVLRLRFLLVSTLVVRSARRLGVNGDGWEAPTPQVGEKLGWMLLFLLILLARSPGKRCSHLERELVVAVEFALAAIVTVVIVVVINSSASSARSTSSIFAIHSQPVLVFQADKLDVLAAHRCCADFAVDESLAIDAAHAHEFVNLLGTCCASLNRKLLIGKEANTEAEAEPDIQVEQDVAQLQLFNLRADGHRAGQGWHGDVEGNNLLGDKSACKANKVAQHDLVRGRDGRLAEDIAQLERKLDVGKGMSELTEGSHGADKVERSKAHIVLHLVKELADVDVGLVGAEGIRLKGLKADVNASLALHGEFNSGVQGGADALKAFLTAQDGDIAGAKLGAVAPSTAGNLPNFAGS
eukprot:m.41854 g.41854  ORF g.41854 m.41854 type:complete len:366 (-) comp6064_c0_seq3:1287-2384(-)